MNYIQLKTPNLSVVGQEGYCLAYVTEVFGIAPQYPTAIAAWNSSSALNHPNETPPSNVSVPVYFSYNGPDGHVAVWDNGTIYSTSAVGDKTFSSISELVNWMGEGMTYLGWSEEVNNVKVVQPQGDTMIPTVDLLNALFVAFLGRPSSAAEQAEFVNKISYNDLIPILNDNNAERDALVTLIANAKTAKQPTKLAPGLYQV